MKKQKNLLSIFSAAAVVAGIALQALPLSTAYAAQITNRSLTLQAGTTDGGSKPGGVVNHLFAFTVANAGGANVGSIKFEYCTTASGACALPTGVVTTGATMGSQSGATGFTLNTSNNGAPYLTRTPASITANSNLSYQLLSVTNPTTTNQNFFVRISTYGSADTSGSAIDTGTVMASTATPIVLTGTMPESLVFCTGGTVSMTAVPPTVPDCATANSGSVLFNQLFSPTDTATATTQMAASTNAGAGYAISVNGSTLSSGANTISPMATAAVGAHGVSQFGLNLKANTVATSNPAVGNEVAPVSNNTNYRGQGASTYNTVDNFKFVSGDTVANSASGGPGGSDAQIFTVSYIVNVPGSQPAGTYTTTLTYICTPTF